MARIVAAFARVPDPSGPTSTRLPRRSADAGDAARQRERPRWTVSGNRLATARSDGLRRSREAAAPLQRTARDVVLGDRELRAALDEQAQVVDAALGNDGVEGNPCCARAFFERTQGLGVRATGGTACDDGGRCGTLETCADPGIGLVELVCEDLVALAFRKRVAANREQSTQPVERGFGRRRWEHLARLRLDHGRSGRCRQWHVRRRYRHGGQELVAAVHGRECRGTVHAKPVAGLVAVGLHADHALRTGAEQVRERGHAVRRPSG